MRSTSFALALGLLFAGAAHAQTPAPFAAEMARFAQMDRAFPPQMCETVMTGSSSVRFWSTAHTDLAPLNIINRGFGGSQIADVNFHFNTVIAPYKPRRIVFYAGDNDINAGKSPGEVFADFEKFMALKTASLGETPVYVIAVKPSKARLDQLPQQNEVNARFKAMADARADLVYIDVVTPMMDGAVPRDIFVADDLHMTPAGYVIWTRAVRPVLTAPAPTRAPGCPD